MKRYFGAMIIILFILVGCMQNTQTVNPGWVDKLIKQYKSEPVGNPQTIHKTSHAFEKGRP
jgi:hypothetical protein